MSIDDLLKKKPVNKSALEYRLAPEILAKVDEDLKRVIEAKQGGLTVPGSTRLRKYFKEEYGVEINQETIRTRITKLGG